MTSREMSDARIPGVPWDWLSETAIVLKPSARPFAADTPSLTRSASSRWLRLHGIVPVQVDATPMIGPPRRAGSIPIARKCARAGARSAPSCSPARARRRMASTGASVTPPTVLHVAGSIDAHCGRPDARGTEARGGRGGGASPLELDRDLLSLIQRGVDPQGLAVGA